MTSDGQLSRPNLRNRLPHATAAFALVLGVLLGTIGCDGARATDPSPTTQADKELVEIRENEVETTAPVEEESANKTILDAGAETKTETESAAAQANLDAAVAAIEARGTSVGYIVIDIATGETIEHNADAAFYSASSIKGPYCVSLLRALGGRARDTHGESIRACLEDSSNDDYDALRQAYVGQSFFPDFAHEADCSSDVSDRGGWWHTFYSVRDLAKLWTLADQWLATASEDAAWLGQILDDTLYSQVDECAGGDGVTTWSKAGWFWETGDGCAPVTIDGGAVHAASGDYAIAVAVDRGSDFDAVRSVMEPLVAVWEGQRNVRGL